ncbi:hypothetical protein ALC60_13092, partial [Trachymyrmex zeteki]
LRMDTATFEKLLNKVTPLIIKQNTHLRKSIPPAERLSLTLRHLATDKRGTESLPPEEKGDPTASRTSFAIGRRQSEGMKMPRWPTRSGRTTTPPVALGRPYWKDMSTRVSSRDLASY